jgi:hypothetical protein
VTALDVADALAALCLTVWGLAGSVFVALIVHEALLMAVEAQRRRAEELAARECERQRIEGERRAALREADHMTDRRRGG